ncbi:rho guanine nucleotide exchange factor 16 isoform X2 [Eurytemora carolleeae]|uniref:rho guanine nucleotide exchange factor 16 isoform X2 n=1 Tax=Eurytemora carolleeae TaxID=1294199 RepID=UPI000C780758|nr:rho guanine nucleotide exchange factor 16 isoform X2 [Eurytemora carolleeae]XP_023328759.1 rho guanine nucleotide exchange factor 16 isoform X2 [Eurytemora carolleeae]|eukprot:XP_023328758.1 rho guanine nucleotide exchange factor 16-like isoform X2 [Eurytemora affinis]
MSIDSGGYLVPDQGAHSSSRRKTSRSYSIMRPMVPPPAPPSFNSSISSNSSLTTSLTYQTSSNSVYSNSSSGSSESREENSDSLLLCDSLKEFYTGFCNGEDSLESNSGPLEETYSSSLFQTEPLYQFYHSTDVQHQYEPVQGTLGVPDVWAVKKKRSSAMSIILNSTGRRTLWAELSEVKESGILRSMNEAEKILQESLFEVISSEASYLKSLNILISHFVQSPTLSGETAVITKREQRILFSEALLVRSCSERFLSDLESAWQESVLLHGIPEIVRYHAKTHFQVYVKYCSNQIYQDRMLKKLRLENPKFVEALKELESSQKCQSLAMHSFLMLPMQRITRLPLLAEAVLSRLPSDSAQLTAAREAVNVLNGLVTECNESARSMERMEELLLLSQQLDFRDLKAVPIISASRWLVKKGNVTKICLREGGETAKLTFGRRIQKYQLTLILLTDLLLVLKKKGEDKYSVQDYCPRNMIQVMDNDGLPGICEAGSFPLWITLLQNSESRTQELLLSFNSASNRRAWADLLTPQPSQIAGEKIYEDWDCPRVEANTNYTPENENEVGLEKGEVANVLKKSQGIILELTETESSRL